MITTLQEIGAGAGVMAAAVVMGVVATAAGDIAPIDVVLREWGPLGAAVFVLYRRVDKLEQRIQQNAREIDDLDG